MRSPAAAIAWEFRQRHRWGLLAVAVYLIATAMIQLILKPGQSIDLDDAMGFAIVIVVPVSMSFTYFLAVFTFGLTGDLAARNSMYPARMLTLPVTSGALAGWPMLYGSIVMAILWLVTRLFAVWPSAMVVPLIWPALLAASLLAWTQALTWMSYGLPGLRVIVVMLWLVAIDTIALIAIYSKASELVMLAILAPHLPLAYLVARYAVARARRGDTPDWRPALARLARPGSGPAAQQHNFTSAERAQFWFEWRRYGRSLPVLVGLLLPFELALLFAAGNTPALVVVILFCVLLTPPFMAAFVAATVSRASTGTGDSIGLSPFIATRPLSSAALIGAKLKMTVWSTLLTWLLVILAIPIALELSDTRQMVVARMQRMTNTVGTTRTIVLALLLLGAFMLSTWKQLIQTFYIRLTGRGWIIRANAFLMLSALLLLGPLVVILMESNRAQLRLWNALPWIPVVLVALKMPAAAWVATQLYRSRLLSDRALVGGAVAWSMSVVALFGLLIWWVDTPFIPHYVLMFVAILFVPLARLSAAPLALAWNRHR